MPWMQHVTQLGTVRRHILLTHTEEKPHECTECPKKFSIKIHLKNHMLTHTGEKLHECSECHKKFSLSSNLQRHMLTHTRGKPHECSECHKKFSQLGSLQSHMLTHTGEKPHKCIICQRGFARKGNLKRHVSQHSEAQHSQWEESLKKVTMHSGINFRHYFMYCSAVHVHLKLWFAGTIRIFTSCTVKCFHDYTNTL